MLAWRLDGSIEFWNAGAERLYGFAQDEAVGRISHALLQTEFPIDFADLRSQLENRGEWLGDLRHICKDGSKVVVESHMQLFSDNLVLEANRDITKPMQIEAALRESEQRLRWLASLVDSSDDAIVGKISEEREILTRIRRGERIDHFETVRQHKHGSLIVVSLTVSPVKDANGKIVGASKIARDITEQKRNQELIVTLAREAEHRSKNLLANALATVNLSQSNSSEGLKKAITGRIQALANVCSLFAETRWIGAELSAIATQELAPYSEMNGNRTFIDGPQTLLEPDAAQAIAITLHELATNAAKYGALSTSNGQVRVEWSYPADGRLRLCWMETGGPVAPEPTRKGLGRRIIEQMIIQQKGKVRFDWRKDGLVCEITLPVGDQNRLQPITKI
jgi:PAS domain S-box-containing protein